MTTTTSDQEAWQAEPVEAVRVDEDTPIWHSMAAQWAKITGTAPPAEPKPVTGTVRKPRTPRRPPAKKAAS